MKQPIDINKIKAARQKLQAAPVRVDSTNEILRISDAEVAEIFGPGAPTETVKQPGDSV